jgi:hypothetical protein
VGRLMKRLFLIAMALLALGPVYAAELTALRRDQRLGARIQGLNFPASLRKELVSGLTNRLLIKISLRKDSRVLADAAVEIAVKYDLWDEIFHINVTTPHRALMRTETSLDSALRSLTDLRLSDILDVPASGGGEPFVLEADLLLNPIDRERMDKIRQWVARNSTAAPGDSSSTTRTSTASSELFARIFEQYAAGKDMAATWTLSLSSQPFRWDEISGDAP